jgi:hypothetical protein
LFAAFSISEAEGVSEQATVKNDNDIATRKAIIFPEG